MARRSITSALCATFLLACAARLAADDKIRSVDVYPKEIKLQTSRAYQAIVAVATTGDDITLDVTDQSNVQIADTKIAKLDGRKILPVADGQTQLVVEHAGHKVSVPITVQQATDDRPISFQLDVMPVFARTGCNTGSCHGAARGKDGFRLSLFGYDPDGDHFRLTREIGARRVNLALPEKSLLLEKSVGAVPHTGGKRFDEKSDYYESIHRWLSAGAPKDAEAPPTVERVELFPPGAVLRGKDTKMRSTVVAHYADGSSRDVTNLAVFSSSNDASAAIDEAGVVTAGSRGEAFVMARFDTHTVGSHYIVLPSELKYEQPQVTGNYIDELIGSKLHKLRMTPSEICTDEEFLRRVTLDITGVLPTEEEYHAFINDVAPDKRTQLVDRLLGRKEFAELWAMKWADLLMVRSSNRVSYKSIFLYSNWLTNQISSNVPLDQMVRELLTATGGTFSSPPTNYYSIERDTEKTAENVAQTFMGIRTQCAQCHNHPFDRWTMDDYYSFAAFFGQIGRKNGEDYREQIIYNRGTGDVKHLVGGRVMAPKFLGGAEPDTKGKDRRAVLAEWLTAADNPYFAPNVANRVWAHFFGRGIVEPVDDIRISNPPSNQELFDELGRRLVEYKYDFKRLVRDICASQAYQRSTKPNENNAHDQRNFARALVRRIPAEALLDSISRVTDTKDKFRGLPLGARAIQIADARSTNYFLTTFGKAKRETVCACEVTTAPTLSQALHLINGNVVQGKVSSSPVTRAMVTEKATTEAMIERLYVRSLSRKPTENEMAELVDTVNEAKNQKQGIDDVFWALLNSREFLFNH
ncbi:MAG: DUF1549 and DUF1553 domain-containing protein [Pirellulales bacterium]|nr:DUF1549 and DUF1553 domain-containing protein [Pirellulales bacterium]